MNHRGKPSFRGTCPSFLTRAAPPAAIRHGLSPSDGSANGRPSNRRLRDVRHRALAWSPPLAAAAALLAVMAAKLAAPVQSDEVFTLEAARLDWPALWAHLRADVHPPLYYAAVKIWLELSGFTLVSLRLFSLLMAATALIMAGLLLPPSVPGRGWASWFLAANGILLVMAAYGRMYAMLVCLCVLAWLASDRRLREGGRACSVLAAASVAAGQLTHHFFGIFLAALVLWLVLVHGRSAVRLLPEWSAGLALWALVWGRAAWEQVTQRPQHLAWVQPVDFLKWAETAGAHAVFVAAALPAALLALAFQRRAAVAPWPREARAAAAAFLLALVLPGVISLWKPVFKSRFTIIAAPFMAAALAPLGGPAAGVWPVAAMAAGAAWIYWPASQTACTSLDAARQLAAASASDTVVFCRLTRKPVEFYWQAGSARRQSFPAAIDAHPGYEGLHPEEALRAEARRLAASLHGRVFVLADTTRPAPRILLEALEEAGFQRQSPLLQCASASSHYFNLLAVFHPPLRPPGFPSAAPPGPGSPPRDPVARAYAPR